MTQSTQPMSQKKTQTQTASGKDGSQFNGANRDIQGNRLTKDPVQPPTDDSGSLDGTAISLERYWSEIYQQTERFYEWNNGILEVKPMADLLKFKMYVWFLYLLKDYLSVNAIAEMVGQEIGFSLNLTSGTKVRAPDLGIVLNSNPVPIGDRDRSYNGIFDLCIEFVSDSKKSEIERDTIDKYGEYAQGGVTEYFILDESPEGRTNETAFHRLGAGGLYQPIQPINGVIRSSVLPGFQFRIADLYSRPNPSQLLSDVVYQSYVFPELWEERRRAERAETALQQSEATLEETQSTLEETQSTLEETQSTLEEEQERKNRVQAYLDSQGISLPDDI